MIIDTSALIAILFDEHEAKRFIALIAGARSRAISAATYVELAAVVDGRRNPAMSGALDSVLARSNISVVPFTTSQARIARDAYQRFGRGSGHPARLNMGDCFSYALARELGEPLLFKGRDFALTDIELVVEPVKRHRLSEALASYGSGAGG